MSTPIPAPPKHRASIGSSMMVQPSRLAYETRIKWNILILVAQLFLSQIGVWDLIMKVINGVVGETIGWIIDWLIVLLPSFNVLEALWARATYNPPRPVPQEAKPVMTPAQKKIQSLSTSVPASVMGNSNSRGLGNSQNSEFGSSRKELRFPDLRHSFAADNSFNSGLSTPSPSAQARSRMKKSINVSQRDLFASRSSSAEASDTPLGPSASMSASTRNRRRAEGANSREPSPFSFSSLSLKSQPKPGRALDSSSLQRLVS
ncbi:hypothetical protein CPB86DRAFT_771334 [Serendipita vermifera]|nr:hypothetical protein CPB86DRAFT_771334 [Serendipita vermifera]